ncbi:MAG: hypothetical protein DMF03_12255, partial [Verrucomicrobia bacterium]
MFSLFLAVGSKRNFGIAFGNGAEVEKSSLRTMKAKLSLTLFIAIAVGASAHAATLTVTNTNDNLAGSLRQAIRDASSGDTIVFNIPTNDPGYNATTQTWTVTLTSAELMISNDLTIDGGGQKIIVQRSAAGGTPNFRIFNIVAGNVTLSRLTIANGLSQDGTVESKGGGVRNAGTLTLTGCTITGNTGRFEGGGLYNDGTTTVNNCTFNGNSTDGGGGGIQNDGNLALNSCTISGNIGVGAPPGVDNTGTAHVHNSVLAGNTGSAFADAVGAYISDGYNFIGRATGPSGTSGLGSTGFGQSGSHDQVGTFEAPADPKLGPLQDNGGPTQTMSPLSGSPLIDQGDSFGVTTDQRGFQRPLDNPSITNAAEGDGSDIGAVETDVVQSGPTFVVNTSDEHSDEVCGIADCSLWDAANASNANTSNNSVITFTPGLTGTINVTIQPVGIILVRPVNIVGPGARLLTVSAANAGRVFFLRTEGVRISGLTIANANVAAHGAGIFMDTGTSLTLESCAIVNNTASGGTTGGGI